MSNTVFKVTDDILADDSIDPGDPCGCYIHAAIIERLNCNKRDVLVGSLTIDIGEQECIPISDDLTKWQEDACNGDMFGVIPESIDIVWDEKQNLLYIEGEELDE